MKCAMCLMRLACKCRLDTSVCNYRKCCNNDKCRCECNELIDKGSCDDRFVWNPSLFECECDKLCDIGKYLDYANCKCRKRQIDRLVEKCSEDIGRNEMVYNSPLYDFGLNKKISKSCMFYVILLIIACIITMNIISGTCFNFYQLMERKYFIALTY